MFTPDDRNRKLRRRSSKRVRSDLARHARLHFEPLELRAMLAGDFAITQVMAASEPLSGNLAFRPRQEAVISESGQVLVTGNLSEGGITPDNSFSLALGTLGNVNLIARFGDPIPGTSGVLYDTLDFPIRPTLVGNNIIGFALSDSDFGEAHHSVWKGGATGVEIQTPFADGTIVAHDNDTGVSAGGHVAYEFFTGDGTQVFLNGLQIHSTDDFVFVNGEQLQYGSIGFVEEINASGQFPLSMQLFPSEGPPRFVRGVHVMGPGGVLRTVTNETIPTGGLSASDINAMDINNAGQVLVEVFFTGTGITSANNQAVYLWSSDTFTLVAREGETIPGSTLLQFPNDVRQPTFAVSGSGQVLYNNATTDSPTPNGIAVWTNGTWKVIAEEGMQAPGAAAGVTFVSFGGASINDKGIIVFSARLSGQEDGIWALVNGQLKNVVLDADELQTSLGPRNVQVVQFEDETLGTGENGRRTVLTDDDRVVFTTALHGVFVANLGAPPEQEPVKINSFTHKNFSSSQDIEQVAVTYVVSGAPATSLELGFFGSADGRLDDTDSEANFSVQVSPGTVESGGLSLFSSNGVPQDAEDALKPGTHVLVISAAAANFTALAQKLKDANTEIVLAVVNPDRANVASDEYAPFIGVHQVGTGGRAAVRTGFDTNDFVQIGSSLNVTFGLTGTGIPLMAPEEILVVTSTGADLIWTSSDANTKVIVRGGAGNDLIIGGSKDDDLDGGADASSDVILGEGFGLSASFFNANKADLLEGKIELGEVAFAPVGDGNDLIQGGGGFDVLIGGPGDDRIFAGDGGALIFGDAFSATASATGNVDFTFDFGQFLDAPVDAFIDAFTFSLEFEAKVTPNNASDGKDTIVGGNGIDIVLGGGQDDTVYTGGGLADLVFGNDGLDTVHAEAVATVPTPTGGTTSQAATSAPILSGDKGNDTLFGGTRSLIFGGDDDDTIRGGENLDVLIGDGFELKLNDAGFIEGFKTFLKGLKEQKIDFQIALNATGGGMDTIDAFGGPDFVIGGDGRDIIHGGDGGGILFGDSFNITAGPEDAEFTDIFLDDNGDEGDDESGDPKQGTEADKNRKKTKMKGFLSTAAALIGLPKLTFKGEGNDDIFGGSGIDLIIGGGGNDTGHTGDGEQSLADAVLGLEGNDTFRAPQTFATLMIGGAGNDNLSASEIEGALGSLLIGDTFEFLNVPLDLKALLVLEFDGLLPQKIGIEGGVIQSGDGEDTLIGANGGFNVLIGGAGKDNVQGNGFLDVLMGDTINPGGKLLFDFTGLSLEKSISENLASIPQIELPGLTGDGFDEITGNAALTFAIGGGGNDTIFGGNIVLDVAFGIDTSFDLIFGNDGNDIITGNSGYNVIFGGHGNDEIEGGDDGNIIFGDTLAFPFVDLEALKNLNFVAGVALAAEGFGDDDIHGGAGFDFLVGGDGKDCIHGGDGFNIAFADAISVGAGTQINFNQNFANQSIFTTISKMFDAIPGLSLTGDGNDEYLGGTGTDIVFAGDGSDLVLEVEGSAFNVLDGGDGLDNGPDESTAFRFENDQITIESTCFNRGEIQGHLFEDMNGDGDKDSEDTPVGQFKIFLFKREGDELIQFAETTTDDSGNYKFEAPAGAYIVSPEDKPDSTLTLTHPEAITIAPEQVVRDVDFGLFKHMTLRGLKFIDVNGDGFQNAGELGEPGWTIELLDNNNQVIRTIVTDDAGEYRFVDLNPTLLDDVTGAFTVREVEDNGFTQTRRPDESLPLKSGDNQGGFDFGNFESMVVRGFKYQDTNGNGVRDSGEPGLADWTIHLDLNNDGSNDYTDTTDANGLYSFSDVGLQPDQITSLDRTFVIREESQQDWVQTSEPIVPLPIKSGESYISDTDIGNFKLMTVRGVKFDDTDGDGVKDAGEPGVGGVVIEVDIDGNGDADYTDTTANDGSYEITNIGPRDNLTPGQFIVREILPSGTIHRLPSSGQYSHTIESGLVVDPDNFGNFTLMTIGGVKYDDLNGNGVRDGNESGLSGWTINVDVNSDGTIEHTTTTSASGLWDFTAIVGPGDPTGARTYTVTEEPSAAQAELYVQTGPAGSSYTRSIESGAVRLDHNFGNFELVDLAGVKFADLDGNGARGPNEPGLGGFTIQLDLDNDGSVDRTAVTTATGNYTFDRVGPGTHKLSEIPQAGYNQTFPAANQHLVTTTSGDDVSGLDFGNKPLVSFVAGTKYNDLNRDGDRDAGEPGLPGWIIYLDADNDGVLDNPTSGNNVADQSATEIFVPTDAGGNYLIVVQPSTYVVRELLQPLWQQSAPTDGFYAGVIATAGDARAGLDFGNFERRSIAGTKFEDLDGDGQRDAGEPGLVGWTIELRNASNVVIDTETTDSNGAYRFVNLDAGVYTVTEVSQAGFLQTLPGVGGRPSIDLTQAALAENIDFGNFELGIIRGVAFSDDDESGTRNGSEGPLVGWTVFLDADDDGELDPSETSVETNAGGEYQFTNLTRGPYTVAQVLKPNFTQSAPAADKHVVTVATSGQVFAERDFGNFSAGMEIDLGGSGNATSVVLVTGGKTQTINVRGGVASLRVTGDNMTTQNGAGPARVTGDNLFVAEVNISQSTRNASLNFQTTGGDGQMTIGDLIVAGSIGKILGRGLNVTGNITIGGTVKSIEIGTLADDHVVTIGAPERPKDTTTFIANLVTETDINSGTPLKKLSVAQWIDDNDDPDTITTPWIGKITSRGDFQADLVLSGVGTRKQTLGKVRIDGDLSDANWNVTGNAATIAAKNFADSWTATFSGNVQKLRATEDLSGDVTARAVDTVSVDGDLRNFNLTLTQAIDAARPKRKTLDKLVVDGLIEDSTVRSAGHIGKVRAGAMLDSLIFAGVNNALNTLPTSAADFTAQAMLKSIKVRGLQNLENSFAGSHIAAWTIDEGLLTDIATTNAATKFGLAARAIDRLHLEVPAGPLEFKKLRPSTAPDPIDDLELRLV